MSGYYSNVRILTTDICEVSSLHYLTFAEFIYVLLGMTSPGAKSSVIGKETPIRTTEIAVLYTAVYLKC
jgi:hypothetical protein